MATATRPQIEKIVRSVLSEEQGEHDKAMLKAIDRVSRLLTQQVIPNLPDGHDEDEAPSHGNGSVSRSAYAMSADADEPDDTGIDDPGVDDPDGDIPQPVTEAFEEMFKTLSPEQATALAAFFGAVSKELGSGGEDSEDPEAEPAPHSA